MLPHVHSMMATVGELEPDNQYVKNVPRLKMADEHGRKALAIIVTE